MQRLVDHVIVICVDVVSASTVVQVIVNYSNNDYYYSGIRTAFSTCLECIFTSVPVHLLISLHSHCILDLFKVHFHHIFCYHRIRPAFSLCMSIHYCKFSARLHFCYHCLIALHLVITRFLWHLCCLFVFVFIT